MSRPPAKASSFLAKLNLQDDPPAAVPAVPAPANQSEAEPTAAVQQVRAAVVAAPATAPPRGRPPKRAGGSRQGLKHIGGYLSDETAEQFALLKIRLKLGNDDLLTAAIGALYRTEGAKRKFGD